MRRAANVDKNQAAVIDALKRVGVSVEIIKQPVDLLLCCRGETSLMEVKNPDRTSADPDSRLTKAQVEFIARWPGKIHIARTPEEAVKMVLGEKVLA
jgi:hypothetical protein